MKKVWKGLTAVGVAAAMAATGFIGVNAANAATIELGEQTNTGDSFVSAGRTFAVYQLMTGDVDASGKITNAKWGENAKGKTAGNNVTQDEITDLTNAQKDAQCNALSGAKLGKALYDAYVNTAKDAPTPYAESLATKLVDVPAGWYVIVETTKDLPNDTSKSLYMFAPIQKDQALVVKPKTVNGPDFIKKVQENTKDVDKLNPADSRVDTDNRWNDIADYNIGDDVPFKLTATLPTNYADYTKYTLVFTDTRGTGFDQPKNIVVKAGEHTLSTPTHYAAAFDGQKMKVSIDDLKTDAFKDLGIAAGTNITVDYTMRLNDSAVIGGNGNPNTAELTYSSNPQVDTETDESHTEYTKTFTYNLKGTKKQTGTENTLSGAKFVLQRQSDNKFQATATVDGKSQTTWIDVTLPQNLTSEGVATALKNNTQVKTSTSDASGVFGFTGLDFGEYNLWEIEAPENFNLPETAFAVSVTSETENIQTLAGIGDQTGLKSVGATIAGKNCPGTKMTDGKTYTGEIAFDIENSSTSKLPETGGMGTVVLYTVGGLIVLIAGVGLAVALRRRQA